MMGRTDRDQSSFFYEFRLDDMIPKGHVLRPRLLIRMHLVGYCFGIRSERKLCEEVMLHLGYRWSCRLDPTGFPTTQHSPRTG